MGQVITNSANLKVHTIIRTAICTQMVKVNMAEVGLALLDN